MFLVLGIIVILSHLAMTQQETYAPGWGWHSDLSPVKGPLQQQQPQQQQQQPQQQPQQQTATPTSNTGQRLPSAAQYPTGARPQQYYPASTQYPSSWPTYPSASGQQYPAGSTLQQSTPAASAAPYPSQYPQTAQQYPQAAQQYPQAAQQYPQQYPQAAQQYPHQYPQAAQQYPQQYPYARPPMTQPATQTTSRPVTAAAPTFSTAMSNLLRAKADLMRSAVQGGVNAVLWLPRFLFGALRGQTQTTAAT